MRARVRAISAGFLSAAALVVLGAMPADATTATATATAASAGGAPPHAASPEKAASAPGTLDTLSRFFSRDGALARSAAAPRIEGASVPVRILSPDFVAGRAGAPVARVEFHASKAVASDGRTASLWTVRRADGGWQVVNIATGADETRYAAQGARALPGGVVFREPQIDAWYVHRDAKVLPLDEDAVRAVGRNGTTLAAYRERVVKAYGDKLPGSVYARKGAAGGYAGPSATAAEESLVTAASATAAAGAALALALIGTAAWRRRRSAPAGQPTA